MDTQTRTSGADAATLGLGSVLVGSLPAELMTDDAPDRYTVEAVFTRRPEKDEVREILGTGTRDHLANAGYPTVELTVADRRLVIENTNLEELRDGLAGVIADMLAGISTMLHQKQEAAAMLLQEAASSEHDRAAAVETLAESIAFRTTQSTGTPAGLSADAVAVDDGTQLAGWGSEGGRQELASRQE